jgi:hypothetical protein
MLLPRSILIIIAELSSSQTSSRRQAAVVPALSGRSRAADASAVLPARANTNQLLRLPARLGDFDDTSAPSTRALVGFLTHIKTGRNMKRSRRARDPDDSVMAVAERATNSRINGGQNYGKPRCVLSYLRSFRRPVHRRVSEAVPRRVCSSSSSSRQ